jgi:hydroxymethylglutaryl-CoA reductase
MQAVIVDGETVLIKSRNAGCELLTLNAGFYWTLSTSKMNPEIVLYQIFFNSVLQISCKIWQLYKKMLNALLFSGFWVA